MRKVILAAAIVLTTGVLTIITRDNDDAKTVKIARVSVPLDKNVLGNAD